MGTRLCRSPWRLKLVCYSEHKGRSLFQQSLIYVSFCLFFDRVNLHSFNARVRGVILPIFYLLLSTSLFYIWSSFKLSFKVLDTKAAAKFSTQAQYFILSDLYADNVKHISYFCKPRVDLSLLWQYTTNLS